MNVLIDIEITIPMEELHLCGMQSEFLLTDSHICNIDGKDVTEIRLSDAVTTIFNSTNVSHYMIELSCELAPPKYPVNLERLCMRGWMNAIRNTQGGVT